MGICTPLQHTASSKVYSSPVALYNSAQLTSLQAASMSARHMEAVLRSEDVSSSGGFHPWSAYRCDAWHACRSALAREAPAALSAAGAALAVAFMRTGMALEDGAMLRHLMRLLCRPLADWGMPQPVRAPACMLPGHAPTELLSSTQPLLAQSLVATSRAIRLAVKMAQARSGSLTCIVALHHWQKQLS